MAKEIVEIFSDDFSTNFPNFYMYDREYYENIYKKFSKVREEIKAQSIIFDDIQESDSEFLNYEYNLDGDYSEKDGIENNGEILFVMDGNEPFFHECFFNTNHLVYIYNGCIRLVWEDDYHGNKIWCTIEF